MSSEEQVPFNEKYSSLFENCISCSIPNGWYNILDVLFGEMEHLRLNGYWDLRVEQVKEKFAEVRIYYSYHRPSKSLQAMVRLAEYACDRSCQECGKPADVQQFGFLLKRICENCKDGTNFVKV